MPGYEVIPAGETTFEKIMHKTTSGMNNHFNALLSKDHAAQQAAAEDYFRHFNDKDAKNESDQTRKDRAEDYATIARQYYNLVTDLYEYGWSSSFHFCRFARGEPFRQAIARHEHYLALVTGLQRGMSVLDVGCGVGGPAREIATFTGANITGITINEYQVQRAKRYATEEGLTGQLSFVQGDFMKLSDSFEANSFDAAYAIEATVHAPSLEGVYREVFRVLKPGSMFGVYEWVLTPTYDDSDPAHRQMRLDIEQGDGIPHMVGIDDAVAAMRAAGFELLEQRDLADAASSGGPWYWPLDSASWRHAQTYGDMAATWRMGRTGSAVTHAIICVLEALGVAAPGTAMTSASLRRAARALVLAGEKRIFTPMFLMVARKPAVTAS